MVCEDLLRRFTDMSRALLGENLVGVYLHGSAAMGCFNPKKSDVDLILVVRESVPDTVKLAFMRQVVAMNEEAPPKGLELSVVKQEDCDPFQYPTPYELHFSATHLARFRQDPGDYVARMRGRDKDLAAHFTVLRHCGVVLYGEAVGTVFGEVPKADYIDSLWYDIENAAADIGEHPVYMTLNLCRVLAYLREGQVLSKKAGGEWGLHTLPKRYHPLIREALCCYVTDEQRLPHGGTGPDFAQYMLAQITGILQ